MPPADAGADTSVTQILSPPSLADASARGGATFGGILRRRFKVLIVLALPLLLETFDQTITATAQPHIASSFGRLDLQTWIGTAFILTVTAFLPLFANIADVFGRFWAFFWSLVIFLLGSCICTGAQNLPTLLAGRGISGVGGAGITTVTRIIISDVRSLDDNSIQATIMVSLQGLGYIIGPLVGGALTSISWRYIFAMNIPVATLSIVLLCWLLRDSLVGPRQPQQNHNDAPTNELSLEVAPLTLSQKLARVDWIGAFVLITASILVLFGLSTGSTSLTSSWTAPGVLGSLVSGAVVTAAFPACEWLLRANSTYQVQRGNSSIWKTLRARWVKYTMGVEPMIPLALFRSPDVWISYFNAMTGGMLLFSCLYFLSTYFVVVVGYDVVRSALQLLYISPGLGLGSYVGIYMIKVTRQPRYPIIVGCTLLPLVSGLLSYAIHHDDRAAVNGFLVLSGFGIGITLGALALQSQYSQPPHFGAIIVTLNLFFRNLGGTIGLAQLSAVLESSVRSHVWNLISSGALSASDATQIIDSLSSLSGGPGGGVDSLPKALRDIVTTSYRLGTAHAFLSLVPWCGVGLVLCAFLHNIQEPQAESPAAAALPAVAEPAPESSRERHASGEESRSLTDLNANPIAVN